MKETTLQERVSSLELRVTNLGISLEKAASQEQYTHLSGFIEGLQHRVFELEKQAKFLIDYCDKTRRKLNTMESEKQRCSENSGAI